MVASFTVAENFICRQNQAYVATMKLTDLKLVFFPSPLHPLELVFLQPNNTKEQKITFRHLVHSAFIFQINFTQSRVFKELWINILGVLSLNV